MDSSSSLLVLLLALGCFGAALAQDDDGDTSDLVVAPAAPPRVPHCAPFQGWLELVRAGFLAAAPRGFVPSRSVGEFKKSFSSKKKKTKKRIEHFLVRSKMMLHFIDERLRFFVADLKVESYTETGWPDAVSWVDEVTGVPHSLPAAEILTCAVAQSAAKTPVAKKTSAAPVTTRHSTTTTTTPAVTPATSAAAATAGGTSCPTCATCAPPTTVTPPPPPVAAAAPPPAASACLSAAEVWWEKVQAGILGAVGPGGLAVVLLGAVGFVAHKWRKGAAVAAIISRAYEEIREELSDTKALLDVSRQGERSLREELDQTLRGEEKPPAAAAMLTFGISPVKPPSDGAARGPMRSSPLGGSETVDNPV
jgi:hypothetical protein